MKFKFNSITRKIELLEDYSYLFDQESPTSTYNKLDDAAKKKIQKDSVDSTIVNSLDPTADYTVLLKLPELTKNKNLINAIFDKLIQSQNTDSSFGKGVIPKALSKAAIDYLKITFRDFSKDIIKTTQNGQWHLLEFAKNLGNKGVVNLPYNTLATVDALAKGKLIPLQDLSNPTSWLIDENLYKGDETDQIYRIKLSIFLQNPSNLKKFAVNKDKFNRIWIPDDKLESAIALADKNNGNLTLESWLTLVADGKPENLWNSPVSKDTLEATFNVFSDDAYVATEQEKQRERAGKISLGEWLDNNKIERTKEQLITFSKEDNYTDFITEIFNESDSQRSIMFRSVLVDSSIPATDDGKSQIAKAILDWNTKNNQSKSVDASLKAFLSKEDIDISSASAIKDKLIKYAKTAFSNIEQRNKYLQYVDKAVKNEAILNNMLTKVIINDTKTDIAKEVTTKVNNFFKSANNKAKGLETTFENALIEEVGTTEQGYGLLKSKLVTEPALTEKFEAVWKTPERRADLLKATVKREGETFDWLGALRTYLNSIYIGKPEKQQATTAQQQSKSKLIV